MKTVLKNCTGLITVLAMTTQVALAESHMMTALGAGEGEVIIVAWAGYIERGDSDKAYDWVTGFEKDTGCKVNVKTAKRRMKWWP